MRVKVGDHWYEAEPGQPIMVELTTQDKNNLEKMLPECNRYAEFHDDDKTDIKHKEKWMDIGAKPYKIEN